jgi:hypothetical protein
MRRHHTLVLTVAAALLAAPAAVQAAKPAPATVTIAATPSAVTFGSPVTLGGKLTSTKSVAGQSIAVQADTAPIDGVYKTVATVTTDATGTWTATDSPTALTRYRAKAKGATSPTTDVAVHLRVGIGVSDRTPAHGQRVRLSGRVAPAHDGAPVRIQRRTSSGWRTVARTTLVDAGTDVSRYSKRIRVYRTGTYRVRVLSGDTDHLAGTSPRRRLVVHH